jgi:hypothetical protein
MTQHIIDVPDSAFDRAGPSSGPKFDLDQHRIPNLPPAAYYIPNFITEQEEAYLLQKVCLSSVEASELIVRLEKALSRNGRRWAPDEGGFIVSRRMLTNRLQYWGEPGINYLDRADV